ncbi:MAG: bifunctional phosphoglucose/phosphomannose isomerase [Ignavibacteria bacterium GWB2_35_12]|nr:MAG: bifunctional phosphoglucose/phosphomannose isomerase [Ignavibacteria bacterium GWB2_35_12]OGU86338.1 MAG: bifunctional phosphoglucose/phosphomannose isomerase [Ignavibacteria bacterium RIFOXYA2_FULL_35_10]OGV20105.1 MAG: bifunctional phosphoglucose/phosphomannose isomerase [Ignavibacteria bacterium RIFOXYC2_FULL_35_21]
MNNYKELLKIDSQNMFDVLKNFPKQINDAIRIGKNIMGNGERGMGDVNCDKIAVIGMGGSAIGGDLLKSYSEFTKGAGHLSINVYRKYNIPNTIDENTFVIASSYSGGTEETIQSFKEAITRTKNIIIITSGGELGKLGEENKIPVIKIPSGYMPRCAIGYSFFVMLYVMLEYGFFKPEAIEETEKAINELIEMINSKSEIYSNVNNGNTAIEIAEKLVGKIPIIYSSIERMESVNLRWRCQIQENAKNLAFGNYLPEMNHNEINAFSFPASLAKHSVIIMLRDIEDNSRIKMRFDALKELLNDKVEGIIEVNGEGKYLLTRMFEMIYLGDWLSYYLALLNGIDPTPIPLITKLKNILSDK